MPFAVQARRLPRKNIGDDNFAPHPVGGYEHYGGKNQEKSVHVILILNPAKLTNPQNQNTGSRNFKSARSAEVGISAVLPTIHFVSISFSFSSCEIIPALSGASSVFADVGRHHIGTTAAENRTQTGFPESAN